jgi:pimeloyl-ACP methyl ester carboxylesterase
MRNRLLPLLLMALCLLPGYAFAPTGIQGRVETGTLAGSPYRIEIPAKWNGDLVLLLHGYQPDGIARQIPMPANEMTHVLVAQGYAVAEPDYSAQGWAVSEALGDIERLREHFAKRVARPKRVYLAGFSFGGHLALASLEKDRGTYAGALSLCGVNLPGADVGAMLLKNLVAFDRYFPNILPQEPQGLAEPNSPPMIDPAAVEAALATDETRAQALARGLDIRRPDLSGAIMLDYMVLQELRRRAGGLPVSNLGVRYTGFDDDDAFNRAVRRYRGDPAAILYLSARAPLTGMIDAPVVLQSNIDDPTIPAIYGTIYPRLVASEAGEALLRELPRVGHGHCDFTDEQVAEDMRLLASIVTSAPDR